jgi:succinate dehydrogenase/fumarate reductase-like Fe-S protein
MNFTLHIWRQPNRDSEGRMVEYQVRDISPDMSFLEMLDILNEELIRKGEQPIAFDHDCREGICGSCAMVINGMPHGPISGTTSCQLTMRHFRDGDHIYVEPWRAKAFPVIKDLVTRPQRLRPHHPGWRLYLGQYRRRARRERYPHSQGGRRTRDGCGHLHRLRGLRRSVQKCLGHALRRGQGVAPRLAASRQTGARSARAGDGGPA